MLRNWRKVTVGEILATPRAEGPIPEYFRARAHELTPSLRRVVDKQRIASGDQPMFQDPPAKRGRKPRDTVAMS